MGKEGKKISEKQLKIIVFVLMVVAIISILIWGMVPEKFYEVSEILDNTDEFDGLEVNVKGLVNGWNISDNFTLTDSNDYTLTINVTHNRAFPEGFGDNETVVVRGMFTYTNGTGHIESLSIQIGCPSKY